MRQSWQRIFQICLILATPITLSPQAWAVLWSVSAPFQPMIFKPRHWLAVAGTRGGKRSKNKSRYVKHWAVIIAKERELISSDPPPMSSQGRPVKPLKCPPLSPSRVLQTTLEQPQYAVTIRDFFLLFLPLLSVHDLWKGGGGDALSDIPSD